MSLVVVGSIAFDAVKTPFGERERMLGGSAVHHGRGVITDDIERVEGGRTFFWRGHYDYDLNTAHTDDTQLNVFGDFQPKLSEASRASDVLFLANIQPDLQRGVREQCANARFVAI